jgi:hypothetical protein
MWVLSKVAVAKKRRLLPAKPFGFTTENVRGLMT